MQDCLDRFCRIFGEGSLYIQKIICLCEAALDGVWIYDAAIYMMEHVNKEEVYNLFDRALDAAKEPFFRNNIRLMRMVFRYSDLEISFRNEYNPEGLYAGIYSDTVDDKGEL